MGNRKRAIAIDFDGTLCENNYPDIGEPNWNVIYEAIQEQKHGAGLILWTCREGKLLYDAMEACFDWGLQFDAINDSLCQSGKNILALLLERLELMNIGTIRLRL